MAQSGGKLRQSLIDHMLNILTLRVYTQIFICSPPFPLPIPYPSSPTPPPPLWTDQTSTWLSQTLDSCLSPSLHSLAPLPSPLPSPLNIPDFHMVKPAPPSLLPLPSPLPLPSELTRLPRDWARPWPPVSCRGGAGRRCLLSRSRWGWWRCGPCAPSGEPSSRTRSRRSDHRRWRTVWTRSTPTTTLKIDREYSVFTCMYRFS